MTYLWAIQATNPCERSEMSRSSHHFVEVLVKNVGSSPHAGLRKYKTQRVTVVAYHLLIVTRDRTVSLCVEISLRLQYVTQTSLGSLVIAVPSVKFPVVISVLYLPVLYFLSCTLHTAPEFRVCSSRLQTQQRTRGRPKSKAGHKIVISLTVNSFR